ncbi:MAG: S1/P1 nuclease [Bacteroidia bacterium]|nr:S1/P1 nuclease [Bacteroidia bacterium]
MRFLLILATCLLVSPLSFSINNWGPTGHRATAEIAESYLSRKAKKQIRKLLNGQSLAIISTYADEIKSDKQYRKYGPWHYVNFPFESTYEGHPKSTSGDLYKGIQTCITVLENKNSSDDDKVFHLKLLVHFIGDLHQPLHIGLAEDKGGNDFQVRWFGKGTNLHKVWDELMIEHYDMSYTELAQNQLVRSADERRAIQAGTIMSWMQESRSLTKDIYSNTTIGDDLGYGYMYRYFSSVRKQIQRGGIRLAAILNAVFD